MTDVVGLVKCSNETWYPATNGGNATTIRMCESSSEACIRCVQVVPNGGHVIYQKNLSHMAQYRLLNWANGTAPLGDDIWMCEHSAPLLTQLQVNWTGICAPVMSTGRLTLITLKGNHSHSRVKRSTESKSSNTDWKWE